MSDNWKHGSDNMKCKMCMWFVPKVPTTHLPSEGRMPISQFMETYDLGRCRRHCPTNSGYPVVFVNDWCGDHKLDENKFTST